MGQGIRIQATSLFTLKIIPIFYTLVNDILQKPQSYQRSLQYINNMQNFNSNGTTEQQISTLYKRVLKLTNCSYNLNKICNFRL